MDTLRQDLQHALRLLIRNPAFTIAALIAPALGIGANTAIFSVVNAVLLRPLPYAEPDRILGVWATAHDRGLDLTTVSYQRFTDIAERSRTFEAVGAYASDAVTFTGGDEPRPWRALRCSAGLLDVLRVQPALGRNFRLDEDQRGGAPVVILSHDVWQRQFGSAGDIVGRAIALDGTSHTVIGVLPAGLYFPDAHVDVFIPRVFEPSFLTAGAIERGSSYLDLVARLKPGVTQRQAQAELDVIAQGDRRATFLDADFGYRALPLSGELTRGVRPTLLILLGAVGFVLLIACANVANLLLSRAVGRQRETAMRAALGASRPRLIRQFLTESVLLSLVAGALGLTFAMWTLRFLTVAAGDSIPREAEIGLDGTVLLVTAFVTVATGLAFGLVPALQASRVDLADTLKEARGGSPTRRSARMRSALVVFEVAVSVVLLIGAGLLLRSLGRLRAVDVGFNADHVLAAKINLPRSRYAEPAQIRQFYQQLSQELGTLPGVVSVGGAESLPLDGGGPQTMIAIDGRPLPDIGARDVVSFDTVSPGYFRTMGIPLLQGRSFTDQDDSTAPIRVVVSRKFAERFFVGESPIGRHMLLGRSPTPYEIVGVVGDVRQDSLAASPAGAFYLSANQRTVSSMTMVLRTAGPPLLLGGTVRSRVLSLDPNQPVTSLRTMEQVAEGSIGDRRFTLLMLSLFAAMAFVLAATGIYGVMAYAVTQRTGEIGVRMTLGARTGDVLAMVLRQGLGLTLVGVGIGLVVALGLTRIISGLLFGVSATDPLTFGLVALLLVAVAIVASLVPARRAVRIDPLAALRYD